MGSSLAHVHDRPDPATPPMAWRIRSELELFPYRVTGRWLAVLGLYALLLTISAVVVENALYIFLAPCSVLLAVYALLLKDALRKAQLAFVEKAREEKALEFPGGWMVFMGDGDGFYHIADSGRVCNMNDAFSSHGRDDAVVADIWLGFRDHVCNFQYSDAWKLKVLKVLFERHPDLAVVYA